MIVTSGAPRLPEAEIVCGLLRAAGIECGYRETEAIDGLLEDFTAAARARSWSTPRISKPRERWSTKPSPLRNVGPSGRAVSSV